MKTYTFVLTHNNNIVAQHELGKSVEITEYCTPEALNDLKNNDSLTVKGIIALVEEVYSCRTSSIK